MKRFVDGASPRLVIFAPKDSWQRCLEVIDQLVHRGLKRPRAAGGKFDGDRFVRVRKIVDIGPVGRAGFGGGLFGQNSFDSGLHLGALGTNDEQIEPSLMDPRPESDRFEGTFLADKPIDRLKLCCRRKLQA